MRLSDPECARIMQATTECVSQPGDPQRGEEKEAHALMHVDDDESVGNCDNGSIIGRWAEAWVNKSAKCVSMAEWSATSFSRCSRT